MKFVIDIVTSLILILFVSATCFGGDILIVGNNKKYPKVFLDKDKPKGILIDIMKYIDRKIPQSFRYELYPWKRARFISESGRAGIIGFSKNSERMKIYDYSEVMFYDDVVLVVKKGNEFPYNNILDLKGKRIGIQRGASYGDDFEKGKKGFFKIDTDDNSEQRLLKLLGDRIDIAVLGPGKASVDHFISLNSRLSKNRHEFVVLPKPLVKDPNYLAFPKSMHKRELLKEINAVLKYGYSSGDIQAIIQNPDI